MAIVKDVMIRDMLTVTRDTTLNEILHKFENFHTFPLVPVVDGKKLVGIISLEEICEVFKSKEPEIIKRMPFVEEATTEIFDIDVPPGIGLLLVAEDIMKRKFVSINQNVDIREAMRIMKLHGISQIPVVDDKNNLVGIIGIFDIVKTVFKEKGLL